MNSVERFAGAGALALGVAEAKCEHQVVLFGSSAPMAPLF